jgi:hypothetical protein
MNRVRLLLTALLVAALLLGAASGCAKLHLSQPFAAFEPEPEVPEKVVAVWTPAALHPPGKKPIRGFGGRIMFHGGDANRSIPADGNLIIYAFDDADPDPDDQVPQKKYVFPAEDLPRHQSDSALGPSYSVWLPWDAIGGYQQPVSLITRFEAPDGRVIMSSVAQVTLPGKIPPKQELLAKRSAEARQRSNRFEVQQAAYHAGNEQPHDVQKAALRTPLTIAVAPDHARRLLMRELTTPEPAADNVQRRYVELTTADRINGQVVSNGLPGSETSLATRSSPPALPARTAPAAPPSSDPARRQPHLGEAPRRLPSTPRSGWSRSPEVSPEGDWPSAR